LYHCPRDQLAASCRQRAAQCDDPAEEQLLERLAALFEPYSSAFHTYEALPPDDIEVAP
jgi:hypothetical protein